MQPSQPTPQDAPWLQRVSGQPQVRRARSGTSWADLEDDSDEDLSSAASFSSRGFTSDNSGSGSYQSGEPKALGRSKKLRNMALPKHVGTSPSQVGAQPLQHLGDDSPSTDVSSMSESASNTPRSGMASTLSTRSASESGETGSSYQNAGYSIGSALHDVDGCKPCLFVHTHVGCQNGSSCEFCHFVHKRKNKARPCKGKRERYRKLLIRMGEDALEAGSACDASSDVGSGSASCASRDKICTIAEI